MANLPKLSFGINTKRALIDKANARMLLIISVTSFLVVFSLVSCKALVNQSGYQGRVIKAKEAALKQLKANNKNVTSLVTSYSAFATAPINVLGGNPTGSGPRDGDNPKITLDALPSKYDYPGLITGFGKLLELGGYKSQSFGGSDDELAQQNSETDNPQPVIIPFPISITTNYDGAKNFFLELEHSIRPIYVDQITLTTSSSNLTIATTTKTYYLPEKTLKISSKVVK